MSCLEKKDRYNFVSVNPAVDKGQPLHPLSICIVNCRFDKTGIVPIKYFGDITTPPRKTKSPESLLTGAFNFI